MQSQQMLLYEDENKILSIKFMGYQIKGFVKQMKRERKKKFNIV